jgi:hypothetical protein
MRFFRSRKDRPPSDREIRDRLRAAVKAELLSTPANWRERWDVIVGQDVKPNGPWGWMIIELGSWPMVQITRVQPTFPTREAAMAAGEEAAARLWSRHASRV